MQTYVGGTLVDFRWDAQIKKYVRYIDGQAQHANDGKLIATPNVVVQKCRIVPHPQDTDVLGNPSMFTYTVGKGAVSVFRNGRRIDGTWSRAKRLGRDDADDQLESQDADPEPRRCVVRPRPEDLAHHQPLTRPTGHWIGTGRARCRTAADRAGS